MANRCGNNGNSERLYLLGVSKITADGDCSHEIKRCLLLGRKAMTNLDSILKSRVITLPTKSIESMMPSSRLILGRPLFLVPPIPPSIRVFSNESTLRMRWPKYRSFSFSIIPFKEIPGLIAFRMDWLDLL